jgi:hypothetical protein
MNCHRKNLCKPNEFSQNKLYTPNKSSQEKTLHTQQIFHRKYLCIPNELSKRKPCISNSFFNNIEAEWILAETLTA